MQKSIFLSLYYLIFQNLPSSFYPLGGIFNSLRVKCLKFILKIGNNNKIQNSVYVGNGSNVTIGNNCQINEYVKLDNVSVGDYVMIASGVTILGKMHEFVNIKEPMLLQGEKEVTPTQIEDDVWIGTNAVIMPGLKIAKGTIVGAGCVLTKDTEPFGVYGGVPGRLIKIRR